MVIRRFVLPLLGALPLFACATKVGPVSAAPRVTDPEQAAQVTVYRDNSLVGAVATMSFSVDGKELYGLRRGERYSFTLGPGWHSLSYFIGLNDCAESFEFQPRGQYTFRLLPTCGIERANR